MKGKDLANACSIKLLTAQIFIKNKGVGNFHKKPTLIANAIVLQEQDHKFTWLDFLLDIQVNGMQNSHVIACADSIGATHDDARNLLTILIQVVESFSIGKFGSLTIKQNANPLILPVATITYMGLTINIKAETEDSGGVRIMNHWHSFESPLELTNTITVLLSTYY